METKRRLAGLRGLFSYQWIVDNLVFFLFVAFLVVLYIANGHEADKTIRDTDKAKREIRDLEYEYKTLKSKQIALSRETHVVAGAAKLGLKLSAQGPVHLYVDSVSISK
jgi:cell division protein FtsL